MVLTARWIAGAAAIAVVATLLWLCRDELTGRVTFADDIAPLGHRRCAPCHRPGQSAPFDLLTYADYYEHRHDIQQVVEDRYMPPWKPASRDGRFRDDRSLSDDERALFARWIEHGAPEGDPATTPAPPQFKDGWALGRPDAIVELDAPYTLAADGRDEYRNFIIATPFEGTRYIAAWELQPGNRAVHHAILNVDRTGSAREADRADPGPGFAGMSSGATQSPGGYYLVWAPGKSARRFDAAEAWTLRAGTDLVLELHMQKTGKVEQIAPRIALYFTDQPPSRARLSLRVEAYEIDIPAGAKAYAVEDELTLPVDVELRSLFPHAHYLCTTIDVWSRLPDGTKLPLLRIDDWDFNWQDEYVYASPVRLPAGSTIAMRMTYDNSVDNVRNPSRPPVRVQRGDRTIDEMGNVTLQVTPVVPAELERLREAKYRHELKGGVSPTLLYNLANTLARTGRDSEAVGVYERALGLDQGLTMARYNLAGLLASLGRHAEAVTQFRAVVESQPNNAPAHVHLGHSLEALGDMAAALDAYAGAVAADERDARVRVVYAQALLKQGRGADARAQLEHALALNPGLTPAREALARLGAEPRRKGATR